MLRQRLSSYMHNQRLTVQHKPTPLRIGLCNILGAYTGDCACLFMEQLTCRYILLHDLYLQLHCKNSKLIIRSEVKNSRPISRWSMVLIECKSIIAVGNDNMFTSTLYCVGQMQQAMHLGQETQPKRWRMIQSWVQIWQLASVDSLSGVKSSQKPFKHFLYVL